MPTTASASVPNEDEALELLAYLITAARTQVAEAAVYGPLRLLTAARRLSDRIAPCDSDATAAFVAGPLQRMPELAVPCREREQYAAHLDELRRALAAHLTACCTGDGSPPARTVPRPAGGGELLGLTARAARLLEGARWGCRGLVERRGSVDHGRAGERGEPLMTRGSGSPPALGDGRRR